MHCLLALDKQAPELEPGHYRATPKYFSTADILHNNLNKWNYLTGGKFLIKIFGSPYLLPSQRVLFCFYNAGCPSCYPINTVKALKALC